jgi:outer membrane protein OmpA-like peptidoglycan-associated protein
MNIIRKTATTLAGASTLALALATAPSPAFAEAITDANTDADAEDPALAAALRKHFGGATEPNAEAKSSPDAMVSYFTSGPPPGDVTVASRRHLDLDVKFGFDSAQLDNGGIEQLDVAGQALQTPQLKSHSFMLSGHTDDRGDAAYNLDLSRRRAESARQYLIEKYGVDPDRLEATGFGAEQPLSTETTLQGRGMNRRVVLEMVR